LWGSGIEIDVFPSFVSGYEFCAFIDCSSDFLLFLFDVVGDMKSVVGDKGVDFVLIFVFMDYDDSMTFICFGDYGFVFIRPMIFITLFSCLVFLSCFPLYRVSH
jgi:hypothetical protein